MTQGYGKPVGLSSSCGKDRQLLFARFKGYGLVAASVARGRPAVFIYLAGDPPDRLREACERQKDLIVPLLGAQGTEGVLEVSNAENLGLQGEP